MYVLATCLHNIKYWMGFWCCCCPMVMHSVCCCFCYSRAKPNGFKMLMQMQQCRWTWYRSWWRDSRTCRKCALMSYNCICYLFHCCCFFFIFNIISFLALQCFLVLQYIGNVCFSLCCKTRMRGNLMDFHRKTYKREEISALLDTELICNRWDDMLRRKRDGSLVNDPQKVHLI